jgi:hypothetical protein
MSSMNSPDVEARLGSSWRTLATLFVVAVLLNYPWELAQSPLYVGTGNLSAMWWHCFVASVGDGFLVLLIFTAGWAVLRRPTWFVQPGVHGYLLMLTVGLVIGVSVEWAAVPVAGRWTYTARISLVPGLGIGIVLFCRCSCFRR